MVACNCHCLHTNASSRPAHPGAKEGKMDEMNNLFRPPKLGFRKVKTSCPTIWMSSKCRISVAMTCDDTEYVPLRSVILKSLNVLCYTNFFLFSYRIYDDHALK